MSKVFWLFKWSLIVSILLVFFPWWIPVVWLFLWFRKRNHKKQKSRIYRPRTTSKKPGKLNDMWAKDTKWRY